MAGTVVLVIFIVFYIAMVLGLAWSILAVVLPRPKAKGGKNV